MNKCPVNQDFEEQPRTIQVAANRPPSLPSALSPVFQLTRPGPMASTLSAILASLTKLPKHNDVIDKRQTDRGADK